MIPMGTVMAVCLVFGALGMAFVLKFPRSMALALGLVLEAAGIWNAFWYGLQHFSEFWGQMAFWSGLTMFVSGALCLRMSNPEFRVKIVRYIPILALLLGVFGAYYSWTIYNL